MAHNKLDTYSFLIIVHVRQRAKSLQIHPYMDIFIHISTLKVLSKGSQEADIVAFNIYNAQVRTIDTSPTTGKIDFVMVKLVTFQ